MQSFPFFLMSVVCVHDTSFSFSCLFALIIPKAFLRYSTRHTHHSSITMFARNAIRLQMYSQTRAEVLEKTAKYTVGDSGSAGKSFAMYAGIVAFPCVAFAINGAYPPTRRVTDSHGYGGVDAPKNKNAVWQGK
ncbi:membrane-associated protein, putative [Bodo saltans]|uniref:Membrane-associated protein, putative n=1 Tax=Bodo saltans TaxID=75058 RepID=A0A0S4JCK6_BODSA|nr:membrane-associated protein, putative [Bodo saltans]|eukprot:CUG87753.1 membrane-associated protein, putative [Bodo saltans]